VDGIVALLTEDVRLTTPLLALEYHGRELAVRSWSRCGNLMDISGASSVAANLVHLQANPVKGHHCDSKILSCIPLAGRNYVLLCLKQEILDGLTRRCKCRQ
jgi:hypothetical protein